MSDDPNNGVTIREHIEEIVARIERSFSEKIGALQEDVRHLQSNYVTRAEYDLKTQHLQKEIERIDRDQRESFKSLDEEQTAAIKELKDDIKNLINRSLAIAGFGIGVFEFFMKFVAN